MLAPGRQRLHDFVAGRRVAERDGDVAQPALVADATNRTAFGACEEFLFAPAEQLDQPRGVQCVAGREVALFRELRELVPRAYQLTIVAAVDTVADCFTERFGNRGAQLDR